MDLQEIKDLLRYSLKIYIETKSEYDYDSMKNTEYVTVKLELDGEIIDTDTTRI